MPNNQKHYICNANALWKFFHKSSYISKQAGAELCQAQDKLGFRLCYVRVKNIIRINPIRAPQRK